MKVTEGKVGEAKRLGVELRANMKGKQVEMGNMSSDAAGKMPTKLWNPIASARLVGLYFTSPFSIVSPLIHYPFSPMPEQLLPLPPSLCYLSQRSADEGLFRRPRLGPHV